MKEGSLYIWKSLLPSILAQYETVCFDGLEISITFETDWPRLQLNWMGGLFGK